MKYHFLGATGVRVSSLALGTMPFGGDADEATAAEIFARARDRGVNLFDTANVYSEGRSEEILGKLVQSCREEVIIASKGYFPVGSGPNDEGASRYHLRNQVETSLRRLKTDRIDIYYVHHFDDRTALEETLRTLDDLVSAGKILYVGVSNFAAWQVEKAIGVAAMRGWSAPVVVQPMYSLAKRQAEVEILPMAAANSLGVISYSPLGGGLLSGKYGATTRPAGGRLVENDRYKVRYGGEAYYRLAESFVELAKRWELHPASLAIAWVASNPAVTAPLIGAKTVEQLEPALAAADIELTAEQRSEISALTDPPATATDRTEERAENTDATR